MPEGTDNLNLDITYISIEDSTSHDAAVDFSLRDFRKDSARLRHTLSSHYLLVMHFAIVIFTLIHTAEVVYRVPWTLDSYFAIILCLYALYPCSCLHSYPCLCLYFYSYHHPCPYSYPCLYSYPYSFRYFYPYRYS